MTQDELDSSMLSKGYVRTASGWSRPARARIDRHPGTADTGPEEAQAAASSTAELPHTELQECEALDHEAAQREAAQETVPDYIPGVSGVDGESRPEFRISVTLKVSNRGRRDPTGALETICDVITATRRRLSERLSGGVVESGKGSSRRRGRDHHHRTAVEDKVPF